MSSSALQTVEPLNGVADLLATLCKESVKFLNIEDELKRLMECIRTLPHAGGPAWRRSTSSAPWLKVAAFIDCGLSDDCRNLLLGLSAIGAIRGHVSSLISIIKYEKNHTCFRRQPLRPLAQREIVHDGELHLGTDLPHQRDD